MARRRRRRRSRSESPPQMPNRSSLASAYSRHSALTSHPVQVVLALRAPAPPPREPAPGSEPLVVGERVLPALGLDLAPGADLLGLPRRAALLGEERLRVGLRAQGALLPGRDVVGQAHAEHAHQTLVGRAGTPAGPLRAADVVTQPRDLCHDDASPLAVVRTRGAGSVPGAHPRPHTAGITRVSLPERQLGPV